MFKRITIYYYKYPTIRKILIILLLLILLVPIPVYAFGWEDIRGWIAAGFLAMANFIGGITFWLVGWIVSIAQYNDFINSPAVAKGWVLMRDTVNMLFIVIMLLMSFGTIFRIDNYHYKKHLGKVLIMAVLVNFSKAICGFMIDFAQVIMLTFVHSFKDAAAANFINGFHIDKYYQFADKNSGSDPTNSAEYFNAALLALISIIISTIVLGVILLVFMMRIVALWLLVIISPIAFTLNTLPGMGEKYASMWWDYFGKYVITGPLLAFFLWLSLAIMQVSGGDTGTAAGIKQPTDTSTAPSVAITGLGQSEVLLSFVINIAILIGALWMTQQLGVAGGKLAGSAISAIQKGSMAPFKGMAAVGKTVGKWGLARADDLQARWQQTFIKSRFGQKIAKSKIGEAFNLGKIAEHGIQLRTLPAAWKKRNERKERERLGEAGGVAEDIIGSVRSFGKDKTNKSLEMRKRLVQEEFKEVAMVSTDKDYGLHELKESSEKYTYTDEDGKMQRAFRPMRGKEAKVEAILSMLMANHDPNEVFKDPIFGGRYNMETTAENLAQLTKDFYGGGKENQQAARVAFSLQEIGLANKDGWAKGIAGLEHGRFVYPNYFEAAVQEKMKQDPTLTREKIAEQVLGHRSNKLIKEVQDSHCVKELGKNYEDLSKEKELAEKQGDTERVKIITKVMGKADENVKVELDKTTVKKLIKMINSETQAAVAAAFIAKREGRQIVNQSRFQDKFTEVADKNGNRTAGPLSDVGKADIALNGKAYAAHWDFASEETKKYCAQGLDLILRQLEENIRNLSDAEKENFIYFISAAASQRRVNNEKDLLSSSQITEVIKQYAPTRIEELKNINKNREKDGLPKIQGEDDEIYYPKLVGLYKTDLKDNKKDESGPKILDATLKDNKKDESGPKILDATGKPYGKDTPPYSYGRKA